MHETISWGLHFDILQGVQCKNISKELSHYLIAYLNLSLRLVDDRLSSDMTIVYLRLKVLVVRVWKVTQTFSFWALFSIKVLGMRRICFWEINRDIQVGEKLRPMKKGPAHIQSLRWGQFAIGLFWKITAFPDSFGKNCHSITHWCYKSRYTGTHWRWKSCHSGIRWCFKSCRRVTH